MGTEALLATVQMPRRAHKEPTMQAHSLFPQMKKTRRDELDEYFFLTHFNSLDQGIEKLSVKGQISKYFKLCGLYGSGVVPPFCLWAWMPPEGTYKGMNVALCQSRSICTSKLEFHLIFIKYYVTNICPIFICFNYLKMWKTFSVHRPCKNRQWTILANS